MKLSFTHWRLYLLHATGQQKRFELACQSWGLTHEEIKNIITI